MELLKRVGALLDEKLFLIENIDCTIIAQEPKLAAHLDRMAQITADALHIEREQVNFKATTEEGLGFTGTGEGIAAQAICSITNMLDFSVNCDSEAGFGCGGCSGCGG